MASQMPNTGYEPKFCINVSSKHTPINFPTRNVGLQIEYDAAAAASEDLNLPQHFGASSSSQHTTAIRVHPLLKQGSLGTGLTEVGAESDSLPCRTSIKETCVDIDRETVVSSLLGSLSKAKRDRDQNVVQILRDRQSFHKILERKAELPCDEKNWLSKDYTKLRQTWRSNIGKGEIQILLLMRSIRSSRPNVFSYNRRINGLIRLKEMNKSLYGDLEMRTIDSTEKFQQKIAKKLKN